MQDEKETSFSVREVYRKLASALHPDREQDEPERKRKTQLMQRVNVAYANKDLLQLLELQLEVEQIDQAALNAISEVRLTHYNKILEEQSRELATEIAELTAPFQILSGVGAAKKLSPELIMRMLRNDVGALRQNIITLKEEFRLFQDSANIKAMLKAFQLP